MHFYTTHLTNLTKGNITNTFYDGKTITFFNVQGIKMLLRSDIPIKLVVDKTNAPRNRLTYRKIPLQIL